MQKIRDLHGVSTAYSWSRLKVVRDDPYTYFLKYVKFETPDQDDSIYGKMGNIVHDLVEDMQAGKITSEEAVNKYKDMALEFDVMGYQFNRTDEGRNESIGDKYHYANIHFLERFKPFNGKNVNLEEFIEIKLGRQLIIGYVDFSREIVYGDGELEWLEILDWKTSSIYTGKKIDKEKGQLLLYAYGKTQQGYPLDKIRCGWNFTKYCTVDIIQKNGKVRSSNIPRHELGSKLVASAKSWLNDKSTADYTQEQISEYLMNMEVLNDPSVLPDDVRSKFDIRDCIVYISITQEEIDELVEELRGAIFKANALENEYSKTKDERVFWTEITKENEYFFANISEFSRFKHKPYDEYLKLKDAEQFSVTIGKKHEDDELIDLDKLLAEFEL